jgi:pimeloyl-ACP methyl ester carboxylesterase
VVLRHESPRSSLALVPLLTALAGRFTAIAIDTPGYGLSEPLEIEAPTVADYAEAMTGVLDALGIERCALYGNHTGACIALAFAAAHPERTSGVVLEGLPVFTAEERAELVANYTPPIEPRIDGGHLANVWSQRRDGHMYFPWYRRSLETRVDIDLSHPAIVEKSLHDGVLDQLRATPSYALGYQAGFRYEPEADLRAAQVPVIVAAGERDLLVGHLDRLPADVPAVRTVRLKGDHLGLLDAIGDLLAEAAAAGAGASSAAPAAPRPEARPGRLTKTYATTEYGQLLTRLRADAPGRPLVLLHGSPTSAFDLEPLLGALAAQRPLIAFDTLGNGDSDKPDRDRYPQFAAPQIRDFAPVVLAALDDLGVGEFDLYGTHTGASIATETAILAGDRVRNVILDGVAMFDEATVKDFLANYFLDLTPRWDGTHLLAAWAAYRDSTMWFPWYRRVREAVLDFPPRTAEQLHGPVMEFFKSGTTYSLSYRAAFTWDAAGRLPKLTARTLVSTHPKDPLDAMTPAAAALAGNAIGVTSPSRLPDIAAYYGRFLDGEDVSPAA